MKQVKKNIVTPSSPANIVDSKTRAPRKTKDLTPKEDAADEDGEQEAIVLKKPRDKNATIDMNFNLKEIDWDSLNLQPIKKDFYTEHAQVTNMAADNVAEFYRKHQVKVLNTKVATPKPITAFEYAPFPNYIHNIFQLLQFKEPTPIQAQAWPIILKGHDMIGIAETGSGKTLAFVLPALIHLKAQQATLIKNGEEATRKGPIVLILSPTRELALQIETECSKFADQVRVACIYGGKDRKEQIKRVKKGGMLLSL